MRVGDNVEHRKTGRVGVVKEVGYRGTDYVRVQLEGRQSVMSPRGLRVVQGPGAPRAQPALDERAEEVERQRAVVKRKSQIPYALLERAVASARALFPDAANVTAVPYLGGAVCEVWDERGGARVYRYNGD